MQKKKNRWPFACLVNGLDIFGVRAYTIWCSLILDRDKILLNERQIFALCLAEGLIEAKKCNLAHCKVFSDRHMRQLPFFMLRRKIIQQMKYQRKRRNISCIQQLKVEWKNNYLLYAEGLFVANLEEKVFQM